MSTERPEFRPIETAPARRIWPFAVLGVVVVALALWVARHNAAGTELRPAALTNVVARPPAGTSPQPPAEGAKAEPARKEADKLAQAKAPEGPNVLGGAVAAAGKLAMVAKAELDRELARTRGAQKQAADYRKQVEELQKQLGEARAQIAALQRAQKPPPPSDQEQILQMLAPVLRTTNNDGRP